MTSSVILTEGFENLSTNSHSSILIESTPYNILLLGKAKVYDEDLEAWRRYKDHWFKVDEFSRDLYTRKDAYFFYWLRVVIEFIPDEILVFSDPPQRYPLEII